MTMLAEITNTRKQEHYLMSFHLMSSFFNGYIDKERQTDRHVPKINGFSGVNDFTLAHSIWLF